MLIQIILLLPVHSGIWEVYRLVVNKASALIFCVGRKCVNYDQMGKRDFHFLLTFIFPFANY